MGCDINGFVEIIGDDGKFKLCDFDFEPFNWRNYLMFSIFADVRNYNNIDTISKPKGLPKDLYYSEELYDYLFSAHSVSWLTARELLEYNYGKISKEEIELPSEYFDHLKELSELHEDPEKVRIVFWFDN